MKLKIPRCTLDEMTAETAFEYVNLDPLYQKYLKDKKVSQINFQSKKGCDATLYINMEKKQDIML